MIELQRLTGMRPGEVTIMRVRDLCMSNRTWMYTPESHKTEHYGRSRTITLGPRAQSIVQPFVATDIDKYLFSPRDAMSEWRRTQRTARKTPMTLSQAKRRPKARSKKTPGAHYTTQSYGRAIARGCRKASVSEWSPNQLRHNAATFLRKEYGIEVARVILGHNSALVTEVYAEVDHAKAAAVMAEVG